MSRCGSSREANNSACLINENRTSYLKIRGPRFSSDAESLNIRLWREHSVILIPFSSFTGFYRIKISLSVSRCILAYPERVKLMLLKKMTRYTQFKSIVIQSSVSTFYCQAITVYSRILVKLAQVLLRRSS